MIYEINRAYLFDRTQPVDVDKAVLITARSIALDATHFYAELIAPVEKSHERVKKGRLPSIGGSRAFFVTELVVWLLKNSYGDLFCLLLHDKPLPIQGEPAMFNHPDDTDCWLLSLSTTSFKRLQKEWSVNGLPSDLFLPYEKQISS